MIKQMAQLVYIAISPIIEPCLETALHICQDIFFDKPRTLGRGRLQNYHLARFYWYLWLVFKTVIVYPACFDAAIYVAHQGCKSDTARRIFILEEVCTAPFRGGVDTTPWFLPLWQPQDGPLHPDKPAHLYFEKTVLSHLRLGSAARALQDQISSSEELAEDFIPHEELKQWS